MKTMTCRQMGGPCDTAFTAETSMDMMNKGAAHIVEMAGKDEGHKAAFDMMEGAKTDPVAAKAWGDKFEADFAALPDNQ